MSTRIIPFAVWESGTNENSIPANDNSLRNEILNGLVISRIITAQPASPNDGDIYIIPAAATGAQWATFDIDDLVIYKSGTWYAYSPINGVIVNVDGGQIQFDGSQGWVSQTALTNPMTTAGDLIVGGVSGSPTRLGIGTNGQALVVSGGVVAWGSGGGGLTNWTDAVNTSSPNATIPVVSLAATNAATNVDTALIPKGTGGFALAVADSATTGGNKRGRRAVDLQLARSAAAQVAAADDSFAAGRQNTIATTATEAAVFGSSNTISSGSTNAFCAGSSNTVGPNSNYSAVFGNNNTATARYALMGGNNGTASGESCLVFGELCVASANYGTAIGLRANTRGLIGGRAWASGMFSASGDGQERSATLRRSTTNATPAVLTADASAPGTDDQLVLPNTSAFLVRGDIIARENATGDCKSWEFRATIKRGANAAATSIVGSAVVTIADADAGAAAWTIGVTADTTNGALAITATGEAAKNIKWMAIVRSVEVAG